MTRHTRTLKKNKFTNGYTTNCGRYEIKPLYGSSIRGGDVSRTTGWCLKDREGKFQPTYRTLLADIRDVLQERP